MCRSCHRERPPTITHKVVLRNCQLSLAGRSQRASRWDYCH